MAVSAAAALSPPVAETKGIADLLKLVQGGHIGIPTFQRNFRWEATDILDLFDSIYRGYPIGALLLWETDRTDGSATRFGPLSYPPAPGKRLLVIDGQQRLTTLAVVLLRDTAVLRGVDAGWSVFFDLEHERFTLPEPRAEPPATWLPLHVVLDTKRYLAWVRGLHDDRWIAHADRLAGALREYRLPIYIVNPEEEDDARRIFKRMNASGKPLEFEEIFGALAGNGDPLQTLGAKTLPFGFGRLPNGALFKVVSAIAGVDVRKRQLAQLDTLDASQWNDALERSHAALHLSFAFLSEAGIPHAELLPYRAVVAPIAKIFARRPELPDRARASLRAWLWRGIENAYFARLDGGPLAGILDVIGEDIDEALRALHAQLGQRWFAHDVHKHHDFRSATTALFGCVLASLAPVDLATAEPIAVRELLERSGSDAFREMVLRRGVPKQGTGFSPRKP
jgi:hypothetical protein